MTKVKTVSSHRVSETNGITKRKKAKKRKHQEPVEEPTKEIPKLARSSDEPPPKKVKWINKQRVLVFGSRGISHRDRHLMEDLRTLMPHARPESKMERKENLFVVNEICEMKNCNKCVLFEGRLKRDLYMWISNVPKGPSAKFLVENVYTMGELKLNGNCLKGSRPLLSFDESFTKHPHYAVLKELFVQVFGTPNQHPKSQPFTDHVLTFTVMDNRIWFRNFQILSEDGALVEIGPRFVLNPVKIFDGSFGGQTLWDNPFYVTPSKHRQLLKKAAAGKYISRVEHKVALEATKPEETYQLNKMDEIFKGDPVERAAEIEQSTKQTQSHDQSKKKKKFKSKNKRNSEMLKKKKKKKRKDQ
ncbi:ribosome biogenesis protein BRX1 homolog [Anabrus simplex]|uniref:ribosome biogenesis protein BRX1 homolog n=1 Tax=Anabrus simplex TaxID=316456 RepID=UPI0035A3C79F